jgi:hypothetical protein
MGATAMLGASALAGSITQASSMRMQAKYDQQQAESQARLNEIKANEAERIGEKEAAQVKRKARQVQGAQRAAMAAQGLDVASGSALELQEETARYGDEDMMTVKNNAYRQAWGYRVEAEQMRAQARFNRKMAKYNSISTLLTGGMQAAAYGMSAKTGGGDASGGGASGANESNSYRRNDYRMEQGP